jgi:hypothetical protein
MKGLFSIESNINFARDSISWQLAPTVPHSQYKFCSLLELADAKLASSSRPLSIF